ncbi:MAG: cytochrome b N-terminal domain-containing protein [Acidobacteriota bacterium]|nr:cytochrome b N-terminal domain-containing protein [Acidobacteriota bacterium]
MNPQRKGWLDWLSERLVLTEIFSLLVSYGFFHAELDSSKPPREALAEAMARPMPSYSAWPRVLGLAAVVLIGVEIFTGGLLTFYYSPTPEGAHASAATILSEVHFGGFVHQVHYWGAQLLLAILALRVLRFFLQRVYRAPRELVWVFASLLLLVAFHAELTGRILPWTGTAYWSGVRALEVVQTIPLYGGLVSFLSGTEGAVISELTLLRFYIFHVVLLPIAMLTLIYLHFSSIRRVGLDPSKVRASASDDGVTFRQHVVNLAILLTVLVAALVTLGVLAPRGLPAGAEPYATLPGVHPPWYLLAPFGFFEITASWLPRWLAGLVLLAATTAFVLVPFWARSLERRGGRLLLMVLAGVAVAVWLALTLYGTKVA